MNVGEGRVGYKYEFRVPIFFLLYFIEYNNAHINLLKKKNKFKDIQQ